MVTLPWRGLGLSSNLQVTDPPNPYRLLDDQPGLFDYVEYSAPLSLARAAAEASLFAEMMRRRDRVPVLFHPVHLNLWGPKLEAPERLQELAEHCRAVGSPWAGNDVAWWHTQEQAFPGYLYLPPPMSRAGLDSAAAHARHVQEALGELPLALENPAVMRRDGNLHVLDFMAQLHAATGCPLLLDLGHLWSFQLTHGHPATAGLDGFPWEAVVELHIAGGVVHARGDRSFYVDDHVQPVRSELLSLLEAIAPRCTRLAALTFEGDGHGHQAAAKMLERLRPFAPRERKGPLPIPGAPTPVERGEIRELALEVYERVFSGRADPDPEGAALERSYRLAVLAQLLDRDWPLTRLLITPDPQALSSFAASAELRRTLVEGEGSVSGAYARFARGRALASRDPAQAAVLAFETWVHNLLTSRPGPLPQSGWRLAQGVAYGSFSADLTELVQAARPLRRHLMERAWGGGGLDLSPLQALGQLVERAPKGPWNLAVREGPSGIAYLPLGPASAEAFASLSRGEELRIPPSDVPWRMAEREGWVRLIQPAVVDS